MGCGGVGHICACRGGDPPGYVHTGQPVNKEICDVAAVAQEQIDALSVLYHTEGINFVDPSFFPSDASLYASTESATTSQRRIRQSDSYTSLVV